METELSSASPNGPTSQATALQDSALSPDAVVLQEEENEDDDDNLDVLLRTPRNGMSSVIILPDPVHFELGVESLQDEYPPPQVEYKPQGPGAHQGCDWEGAGWHDGDGVNHREVGGDFFSEVSLTAVT